MEIGVILLVAFLVLGPDASIDMARKAGKLLHDLRGSFTDIVTSVDLEKDQQSARREPVPPAHASQEKPHSKDDT